MKRMSWTKEDLCRSAKAVFSVRALIKALHLVPAGGNYQQVKRYLVLHEIDTSHFKGSAWNKGMKCTNSQKIPLVEILKIGTLYQSYKLKTRLYEAGLKKPECEICSWSKRSIDGRLPLELDHINGQRTDNRLENLRILCPNCHSLQLTHRGKNRGKNKAGPDGETGIRT